MMDTIIHVSVSTEHEVIDAKGKRWRFEVDRYYGAPWLLRKDGRPAARQPPEGSPFWVAFAMWSRSRGLPERDDSASRGEDLPERGQR